MSKKVQLEGNFGGSREDIYPATMAEIVYASDGKNLEEKINETNAQLSDILKNKSTKSIIQKMINKESVNIVCYGDSVTFGFIPFNGSKTVNPYPETLQKLLRGYYGYDGINVFNEGFSGRQSDELASDEYINMVKRHNPHLVIVMVGLNDKLGNYGDVSSIDFYMDNLKILVKKLKDYELLFMTPTPNYSGNGASEAQITDAKQKITCDIYRKALIQFCNINKFEFLDLNNIMDNYVKYSVASRIDMQPDMLHYSDNYYIKMAEAIYIHKLSPIDAIIREDLTFDCMHGIFKMDKYAYYGKAEENPNIYNLIITSDNSLTCEVFIDAPSKDLFLSILKNSSGSEGEIFVDGKCVKKISCFNSAISNPIKSTYIDNIHIGRLSYGYHKIEIVVKAIEKRKDVYIEGISFKKPMTPYVEIGSLKSIDNTNNTNVTTFRKIGCFDGKKQTRLYVSATTRGGIGIGQTYFNRKQTPLLLIHRNGKEIGLWEYVNKGLIAWEKISSVQIETSHPIAMDFKVDIIDYDNNISIYINNTLLYYTSNIELFGDRTLFIINYKVNSSDTYIDTSITGSRQYDYEIGAGVDDGESYYSYESSVCKKFFEGKWI